MLTKSGYVYIVTNRRHTVLYTGVTSDLERRVAEHRAGVGSVFAARYHCVELVYWEEVGDIAAAIQREKAIKGGSRQRKVALIESINPDWRDLADDWHGEGPAEDGRPGS